MFVTLSIPLVPLVLGVGDGEGLVNAEEGLGDGVGRGDATGVGDCNNNFFFVFGFCDGVLVLGCGWFVGFFIVSF